MDTPVSNITKQITDALFDDPRMKGSVIEVGNDHGIVILTGTVKSADISQAAEEISRAQPGVISVVNELKVVK